MFRTDGTQNCQNGYHDLRRPKETVDHLGSDRMAAASAQKLFYYTDALTLSSINISIALALSLPYLCLLPDVESDD
jgi:hypothetical protein